MLDQEMLDRGKKDWLKLPGCYVIFITEHDVLKRHEQISWFEYRNRDGSLLRTKQHIVYVNCASERDDFTSLGRLIHDMKCTD